MGQNPSKFTNRYYNYGVFASYRPETYIHVRFQETVTFKQVELHLLFNRLKRRHICVPQSQCPAVPVSWDSTIRWALSSPTSGKGVV